MHNFSTHFGPPAHIPLWLLINFRIEQLVIMLPTLCYTCAPWCLPSVMSVHSSVHVQLAIFPTQHMVCWDGACAACVYTICVCYVHCVLYPIEMLPLSVT